MRNRTNENESENNQLLILLITVINRIIERKQIIILEIIVCRFQYFH